MAVRFPKPIDVEWSAANGQNTSGNGDDVTNWVETYRVRFLGGDKAKVLKVSWKYSTRTHKLVLADKQFDLPKRKLAILGYDKDMKPTCEFRDDTPEVVKRLRKELGITDIDAIPAQPAQPDTRR